MNLPNPQPVLDLIEAFRRSKTMFAAVSMGVFDALHEGPASALELAERLTANADAMARLLDGCTALGLLHKRGTLYENDAVAETYLCSGSAHSLHGYVRYSDAALYGMWGHLEDAVREGTHRWTQSFGLEGSIFSAFFRTDEAMRDFLMGMHGFGMLTSPLVVAAFDLTPLSTPGGPGRRDRTPGDCGLRALRGPACGGLRSGKGDGPGAGTGSEITGTRPD